jgi:hypothetical protein
MRLLVPYLTREEVRMISARSYLTMGESKEDEAAGLLLTRGDV